VTFSFSVSFLHIYKMADLNQKALHNAAKQNYAVAYGNLEPKNLFGTRIIFPRGAILDKHDPDGIDPRSSDEDEDEDDGEDTGDDEGVTGEQLAEFTDEQARELIPATETYKIDPFQNNAYLIANRLLACPSRKKSKHNIIRSQQPKGF